MNRAERRSRIRSEGGEFIEGVRGQLPLLLGVAPFGVIFGTLALAAGLSPLEAQGLSVFVFAGSAQFIAVGLVESNTPPLIIVLTIFVVNLRHLLYSASMSAHLSHLPRRWKVALSWLLTDEAYVVASLRYQRPERRQAHWYMLGTGLALWASWQLSTWVGITLGSGIPAAWPLDFALPLTFMALLIPTLSDRPARIAAATAGLLALFLHALPLRLGLLLAAMFGIAAGVIADRLTIFLETTSG